MHERGREVGVLQQNLSTIPDAVRVLKLTSNSSASYRKSPALGLMSTCKGTRRAARTSFMSPAQDQICLKHPAPAYSCILQDSHFMFSVRVCYYVVYLRLE